MIVVVGGLKGGVGKTTIASNLAVCRALLGNPVVLIDADDQLSCVDWGVMRKTQPSIMVLEDRERDFYKRLAVFKKTKPDYDVIVDVGGRDTDIQRSALCGCDVFITPFRPRSLDLWTLTALKRLLPEIRTINPNMRVQAVLNQCEPRGSDRQTARHIIEDAKIECIPTELGYRKAFSDACSFGLGVLEWDGSDEKSIREILSLHDDIYKGNMLDTFNIDGRNIWLSAEKQKK